jgi:hypothetical protein
MCGNFIFLMLAITGTSEGIATVLKLTQNAL